MKTLLVALIVALVPTMSMAETKVSCFAHASIGGDDVEVFSKVVDADLKYDYENPANPLNKLLDDSALIFQASLIGKVTKGNRELILTAFRTSTTKNLQISVVSRVKNADDSVSVLRNRASGSEDKVLLQLKIDGEELEQKISVYAKCEKIK